MEPIQIRKATKEDLGTLLRFEQGVIEAERPFDPTLKKEKTHYYDLINMIEAAHIELVVAESGKQIIGSGYARIEASKPYLQHQQHAYLGFMYVEPEFRGQRVNKAIISALEKWAVAQGAAELRLEVYEQNLPAINAYTKVGFSKHMIEMRKSLS